MQNWETTNSMFTKRSLSHLVGTYGVIAPPLAWAIALAWNHPEVISALPCFLLSGSVIASWCLAALCKKSTYRYVSDIEERAIRYKETTLALHQQLEQMGLSAKTQKGDYERQLLDLEATIEDLKKQLSAHRHHLSLAWQETHHFKEELERQKKEGQAGLDYLHRQCIQHMQSKHNAESMLDKIRADLQHKLHSQKENYLSILSSLEERLSIAQLESQDKESQIELLKENLASIQMHYAFGDAEVGELDWNS
jgi:chromosome segregation ATPase